jgi:hypothetical protein
MLSLLALPLLAVTITAAQSVPSLFVGTVTNGSGQPVAGAQVIGKVGGEFCGQGTSSADGSYGLAIPDMTTRPAACSDPGAQVSIFINGTLNDVAPIGKPGVPTQRNVNADATPSATPTPAKSDSLFTLAFNGEPTPGANGAAVIGESATAAEIEAESESQSGRDVLAIWMFADGEWKVYVPELVATFTTVKLPAALFVVLA